MSPVIYERNGERLILKQKGELLSSLPNIPSPGWVEFVDDPSGGRVLVKGRGLHFNDLIGRNVRKSGVRTSNVLFGYQTEQPTEFTAIGPKRTEPVEIGRIGENVYTARFIPHDPQAMDPKRGR